MKVAADLVLDSSEEVIALDKPYLTFTLDPAAQPDNKGIWGVSDFTMTVKNLTGSYVAVRTKTTKKDVYAVNPTYGIAYPNSSLDIKFAYHIKDLNEDPKKHKFKFEGIIIDSLVDEKKIKEIFDNLISKRIKVKGNAIKREVIFNFKKANTVSPINLPFDLPVESKPDTTFSRNETKPNIETKTQYDNRTQENIPNKQNGNDKLVDSQLQDMKMELQKYKNQLNILKETHTNLKNRVEMEKTKDIQTSLNLTVTASDEKQISKKITLILFVVSIILGFFLSK